MFSRSAWRSAYDIPAASSARDPGTVDRRVPARLLPAPVPKPVCSRTCKEFGVAFDQCDRVAPRFPCEGFAEILPFFPPLGFQVTGGRSKLQNVRILADVLVNCK